MMTTIMATPTMQPMMIPAMAPPDSPPDDEREVPPDAEPGPPEVVNEVTVTPVVAKLRLCAAAKLFRTLANPVLPEFDK